MYVLESSARIFLQFTFTVYFTVAHKEKMHILLRLICWFFSFTARSSWLFSFPPSLPPSTRFPPLSLLSLVFSFFFNLLLQQMILSKSFTARWQKYYNKLVLKGGLLAPTRLRMAAPHVSSNIMFSKSRRKCVSSLGFQKVHHWFVWNGLSSSKTDVKIKTRPFRGTRIPRSEPSASNPFCCFPLFFLH